MKILRKINNYLYHFNWWFEKHSPIYVNSIDFLKVISYWIKASKAFKFPHIEINFEKLENTPGFPWWYESRMCNKWFGLYIFNLGYKCKWDELQFESEPQIDLVLFRKWKLYIGFRAPVITYHPVKDKDGNITKIVERNDMLYYECMLDYLYTYNKDIVKTYNNHCWVSEWDIETCSRETIEPYLRDWAKIKCMEQDIPELHKDYVEKKLELRKLKSEISHSGTDSDSFTRGFNTKVHYNLSAGINGKTNDLP